MKLVAFRRIGFVIAALAVFALVGCGSKVTRTADVSNGDYYSEEEFTKLSKEQRDAYCADLDQELAGLQSSASEQGNRASQTQSELQGIQGEIRTLQSRYDAAKAETDGLEEQIDYYEGLPKTHTVVDGEFLQKISEYEAIYADPTKWPRIYRANKDQISDPNLIYPGWVLQIPRDWPRNWVVKQDEYLSKIASYWEIYDDPMQWTRIYEANKDQIRDPDIIWPDWELAIPR
jgi:nucleoid-associated protein YgaU